MRPGIKSLQCSNVSVPLGWWLPAGAAVNQKMFCQTPCKNWVDKPGFPCSASMAWSTCAGSSFACI